MLIKMEREVIRCEAKLLLNGEGIRKKNIYREEATPAYPVIVGRINVLKCTRRTGLVY